MVLFRTGLEHRFSKFDAKIQRHLTTQENPAPTKPNPAPHIIKIARQHRPATQRSKPNTDNIHSTESRLPNKFTTKNVLFAQSTELQKEHHPAQGHPERAHRPVHFTTMTNANINILRRIVEARREKHAIAKVKMDEQITILKIHINSDIERSNGLKYTVEQLSLFVDNSD